METDQLILYGGFEGTPKQICENKQSLGELLLSRCDEIGEKVILVSENSEEAVRIV